MFSGRKVKNVIKKYWKMGLSCFYYISESSSFHSNSWKTMQYLNAFIFKIVKFWKSIIKKTKHLTKKTFALHIQSFEKYTTQTFGCKTATMELCNKISQLSLVKIISKKQLFFKVELGLKHHSKSLLKIAKKKSVSWSQFLFTINFRCSIQI